MNSYSFLTCARLTLATPFWSLAQIVRNHDSRRNAEISMAWWCDMRFRSYAQWFGGQQEQGFQCASDHFSVCRSVAASQWVAASHQERHLQDGHTVIENYWFIWAGPGGSELNPSSEFRKNVFEFRVLKKCCFLKIAILGTWWREFVVVWINSFSFEQQLIFRSGG